MSRTRQPALGFIFVTLLLDILGIGLIIPILPKLVEQLQGRNISAASHTVGLLASLYALMQFLFAPILGSLSDHFGRRPVILASLFGSGLDYILLAFAPTLSWFFLGRIVAGVTAANITAATAYIADVSPPEKRAGNFGLIGAAFGLGFILGPALGGLLGEHSLRLPFLVSAGLTLANWLYGFLVLPESLAPENRSQFSWKRANPIGSLASLRRYPLVLRLAVALFIANIAQFMLQSIWALYTDYRFEWTPTQVGLSLTFVGMMAALVQGGLARRVIPWLGEPRSVVIGFVIGTISYLGYGLATHGWMIYLTLAFGCLGGICMPAAQSIISRTVGANEQGAVQGALASLASLAGIGGPLIATNLFGWFIGPRAPFALPGVSFFVAAILMLLALGLSIRALRGKTVTPIAPFGGPEE
ncbi:MAG TPA: TCR/Tet family MFS transporter [Verrucomicrobiota bacterium]|nr:tetracycline resistance MFS efflux pump [Verrucomicrobiales bacterium]HRI12169.1 TCR/Tet family MFS transporter [Verrucomicrobiota bacterium]